MPTGQIVRKVGKDKLCPPAIVVSPESDKDIPGHLLSSHPVYPVSNPVIIKELPEGSYSWESADQLQELTLEMIESKLNDPRVADFPKLVKGFEMARQLASVEHELAEKEADAEPTADLGKRPSPSSSRGKSGKNSLRSTKIDSSSVQLLRPVEPPTSPLDHPFPLHLRLDSISHQGVNLFLSQLFRDSSISQVLENAIRDVRKHLFESGSHSRSDLSRLGKKTFVEKEVRSTTLVVRPTDGVAVTSGKTIDEAHKEIRLNANYIMDVMRRFDGNIKLVEREIRGVITHEMVHVLQHDGRGTAPGGLIEGIADWVRLKADLAPPHWKKHEIGERWDSGYERTAYFLAFASRHVQKPWLVPLLNQALAHYEWSAPDSDLNLFEVIAGRSIEHVWKEYKRHVSKHATASPSESTA